MKRGKGIVFRLVVVWLSIFLLGTFWLTMEGMSGPVSMAVIPQAPREGEPITATFKLNNPSPNPIVTSYQFYANGELLHKGETLIAAYSTEAYSYAYENPLQIGEQLNFVVRSQSGWGSYEKMLSSPSYPPQIWSSFVSFASGSISMMSSISSMTYYQSTFGTDNGFNLGILFSIVLIALLIFLELTQPLLNQKNIVILGRYRLDFGTLTWILLIIFMGMVYTRVVMTLTS